MLSRIRLSKCTKVFSLNSHLYGSNLINNNNNNVYNNIIIRSKFDSNKKYYFPTKSIGGGEDIEIDVGIVHFGVGRFHRAHQAVYMDEIIGRGGAKWGICGVCMLPQDKDIYEKLKLQNCRYYVIELDSSTTSVREIGSIVDVLWGHRNPEDVIYTLGKKSVKIVSTTVTEAGYFYHPATKSLDFSNEDVMHDLKQFISVLKSKCDGIESPESLAPTPRTLYGYLSIGMLLRYLDKVKPFTVLSCDNIQGNGDMIKSLLFEFCSNVEESEIKKRGKYTRFLRWLGHNVTYPNSMVDRITPAASDADFQRLRVPFKIYDDALPVTCEFYRQWVIEDKFCKFYSK